MREALRPLISLWIDLLVLRLLNEPMPPEQNSSESSEQDSSVHLRLHRRLQSPAVPNLFTGPPVVWNLAASLTQPIFEGGRLKSNVRLAEAQREQMVLTN